MTLGRVGYAVAALGFLCTPASPLHAQSSSTQSTAASAGELVFPSPTPWGRVKPEVKYDRFTDSTTVWTVVESYKAPGFKDIMIHDGHNPRIKLVFLFRFHGQDLMDTVRQVDLLMSAERVVANRADVKETVNAPSSQPLLILMPDGERWRVDAALEDKDIDIVGGLFSTNVAYGTSLSTETFLRLISKPNVEGRFGTAEFTISKVDVELLRNFAARMVPGIPIR